MGSEGIQPGEQSVVLSCLSFECAEKGVRYRLPAIVVPVELADPPEIEIPAPPEIPVPVIPAGPITTPTEVAKKAAI
jgi:hypothetical protein